MSIYSGTVGVCLSYSAQGTQVRTTSETGKRHSANVLRAVRPKLFDNVQMRTAHAAEAQMASLVQRIALQHQLEIHWKGHIGARPHALLHASFLLLLLKPLLCNFIRTLECATDANPNTVSDPAVVAVPVFERTSVWLVHTLHCNTHRGQRFAHQCIGCTCLLCGNCQNLSSFTISQLGSCRDVLMVMCTGIAETFASGIATTDTSDQQQVYIEAKAGSQYGWLLQLQMLS